MVYNIIVTPQRHPPCIHAVTTDPCYHVYVDQPISASGPESVVKQDEVGYPPFQQDCPTQVANPPKQSYPLQPYTQVSDTTTVSSFVSMSQLSQE